MKHVTQEVSQNKVTKNKLVVGAVIAVAVSLLTVGLVAADPVGATQGNGYGGGNITIEITKDMIRLIINFLFG